MRGSASASVRSRTTLLPTARGLAVIAVTVVLLLGSAVLGLRASRDVAAALLVVLVVAALCLVLALPGLRLRRRAHEDAVPVGASTLVDLALAPRAVLSRVPLAHGTVLCAFPAALGGPGVLPLRAAMPHRLTARGRGVHDLGICRIRAVDPLGMWRLTRTEHPGGVVTALPRVEEVPGALARRAGLAADGPAGSTVHGTGEIGPLARPYAPGDDLRRIQWRASARADRLMTREDEPTAAETAVIVLDDRAHAEFGDGGDEAVRERIVSLAASLWTILRADGWGVRMLDARGEEIVREAPSSSAGEAAAPALAVDAETVREALLALARLRFRDSGSGRSSGLGDDGDSDGAAGSRRADAPLHAAPAGGITTGGTGLAVLIGSATHTMASTGPVSSLSSSGPMSPAGAPGAVEGPVLPGPLAELAPLAGGAGRRLAVVVAPGAREDPRAARDGRWDVLELTAGTPLAAALEALAATGGGGR